MINTIEKAAAFVSEHGNVGPASELLRIRPSESQLQDARVRCMWEVEAAIALLRTHHTEAPLDAPLDAPADEAPKI